MQAGGITGHGFSPKDRPVPVRALCMDRGEHREQRKPISKGKSPCYTIDNKHRVW